MRQSHLILSNAVIIWATQALQLIPQLILVPYLIGTIGEGGYGIYALVWSLMMSIDQLEMSLQSGVVKYSAGFLAQGRIDEVNKVVSSSSVYSIFLAIVACAGILIAAGLYGDPSGQIGSALIVVGILVIFIIPLTPYIAVIQARQRYYVGAIAGTVSKYSSLLVVVTWFHVVGPSLEALIIIMAGMLFLGRLVQVPIAYRLTPGLRNHLRLFDGKSFRGIAAFGAATVLVSVCLAINSTGVRWLMGSLESTTFVTHLAIIIMPGLLLSQIVLAMTSTIMPATSAYKATGNQRVLQELLIRGMRYTSILVLAGCLVAALLMRNVLAAWVGADYIFLAPYALILFGSWSFMLTTSSSHHMLKGLGKLRSVVLIFALGLVVVPIGLILTVFYIWREAYVAVIAGLAAGHLVCGCLQLLSSAKAVHAGFREVFVRVYAEPILTAVAVGVVVRAIVTFGGLDGLAGRGGVSVIAFLLFLGACYTLIATTAERQQVKELIQSSLSKLPGFCRIPLGHRSE
jgi:O-antigen/teichoic acid export membrane protein